MSSERPASDGRAPAPPWSGRRSSARSTAADDGQGSRIVDIGGGTGGFAVRVAELGHRVTVVDPSPDALAALGRRAREVGRRRHRSPGRPLRPGVPRGALRRQPVDVVLCHGVLEVVDDPAAALATIREVLRPGGTLSLLVAQRHAAVIARAMAGHFPQALALLDGRGRRPVAPATGSPPTRPTPCSPRPASRSPRPTASGSSPTWSPARCSTSSPVPPRPWSSWSGPSPSGPSTSRSRRSCTCSRAELTASAGSARSSVGSHWRRRGATPFGLV